MFRDSCDARENVFVFVFVTVCDDYCVCHFSNSIESFKSLNNLGKYATIKIFFWLFLAWNRNVTGFGVRWMETWPLLWSFKSYVILTKSLQIFLGLVFPLWYWNNYGCLNEIIYEKHFLQDSWHLISTH